MCDKGGRKVSLKAPTWVAEPSRNVSLCSFRQGSNISRENTTFCLQQMNTTFLCVLRLCPDRGSDPFVSNGLKLWRKHEHRGCQQTCILHNAACNYHQIHLGAISKACTNFSHNLRGVNIPYFAESVVLKRNFAKFAKILLRLRRQGAWSIVTSSAAKRVRYFTTTKQTTHCFPEKKSPQITDTLCKSHKIIFSWLFQRTCLFELYFLVF